MKILTCEKHTNLFCQSVNDKVKKNTSNFSTLFFALASPWLTFKKFASREHAGLFRFGINDEGKKS
jgi:hypothetical protein